MYQDGANIIESLRNNEDTNKIKSIELAYDLQAGSYINEYKKQNKKFDKYYKDIGEILDNYIVEGGAILDCGTGELTTVGGMIKLGYLSNTSKVYAFDISFSRIYTGKKFLNEALGEHKVECFVGDMMSIPASDSSFDIVWSSHALEPNRERETEIIKEMIRVSRNKVILFEPSYEKNSEKGKKRMDKLKYVKKIPESIDKAGGTLEKMIKIKNPLNLLNPTYAYIVDPCKNNIKSKKKYMCPVTKEYLIQKDDYMLTKNPMIAYPIMDGVPLLKESHAVIAFRVEE